MADMGEGSDEAEARRQDELAKTVARLSDEKRQRYETKVSLAIERYGDASHDFKMGVAKTFAQGLPPVEEGKQIHKYESREYQRVYLNEQRLAQERSKAGAQPSGPVAPASQKLEVQQQPKLADPMAGMRPRGEPRDYGELKKTHEKVAAAEPATALIPKERLESMAERYAEARKAGNLEPTKGELRERSDMAKQHAASQEKLDRAHGSAPTAQQKQERALLDHQQLAERVGTEARMISQQLRKQGNPGAEAYERECRSALHTARTVHGQRQNLGADVDRVRDAARVVRQDEQQKQTNMQEAARGGRTLTSEQMANASPEARQTFERKDRAEAVRATGAEIREQAAQQGAKTQGNARPGGRSR